MAKCPVRPSQMDFVPTNYLAVKRASSEREIFMVSRDYAQNKGQRREGMRRWMETKARKREEEGWLDLRKMEGDLIDWQVWEKEYRISRNTEPSEIRKRLWRIWIQRVLWSKMNVNLGLEINFLI